MPDTVDKVKFLIQNIEKKVNPFLGDTIVHPHQSEKIKNSTATSLKSPSVLLLRNLFWKVRTVKLRSLKPSTIVLISLNVMAYSAKESSDLLRTTNVLVENTRESVIRVSSVSVVE